MKRNASHAGSWYSSRRSGLDGQLTGWLDAVPASYDTGTAVPVSGLKAIIAPHAGYSYSGPAAAFAYRAIDPSAFDRVFILGPSHHFYLDGCALSSCSSYETPLGDLPLDSDAISKLETTGEFSTMRRSVDEDEHSIEMQLPYLRKVFEGTDARIVPILVGATTPATELAFGSLLAPYLADDRTLFVISSDFCHWGSRFRYTRYSPANGSPVNLSSSTSAATYASRPISASIEALDREGMATISFDSAGTDVNAAQDGLSAHSRFTSYLARTKNTICGRHPIGVLLAAVGALQRDGDSATWAIDFVRYEQSSACVKPSDSSVSYASAICRRRAA